MKFGLREVVFILLLAAIPVGSWWFAFRPRNAREAEMIRAIEAKQARLRQLNQTIGAIGDIQNEITGLEKNIALLRSKLPNEKEMDKVLQEVWRLAEANQLTTKSIRAVDKGDALFAAPGSPQSEQPITMKLEGDFRGFYSFMLALENQPRIMRIKRMTLTKPDKAQEGCIQASFDMTVFFEKDKDKNKES
ncbi:MAG: type 4a pilus biogenesis protein PilO [Phycisphaerae bacterium]